MSTPIFIMRIPLNAIHSDRELFMTVQRKLQRKLKDYHVLVVGDDVVKRAEFECFSVDDDQITQIQTILKEYGYDTTNTNDTSIQNRTKGTRTSK